MVPSSEIFLLQREYEPFALGTHQQVNVTGTASTLLALGSSAVTRAGGYLIQVIGGNVRYTLDGETTPTTTLGFRLTNGQDALITPDDWTNMEVITESGTPIIEIQAVR